MTNSTQSNGVRTGDLKATLAMIVMGAVALGGFRGEMIWLAWAGTAAFVAFLVYVIVPSLLGMGSGDCGFGLSGGGDCSGGGDGGSC